MHTRYLFALIACSIALAVVACASGQKARTVSEHALVGRWEGVDRTGKPGAFHFHDDGAVILIIDGRPMGEPGGLGRLTYAADFSKDPIELDIIGIDGEGIEQGRILMIVRFLTPDRIKIRTFFNTVRPDDFSNETVDDTIVLDRRSD